MKTQRVGEVFLYQEDIKHKVADLTKRTYHTALGSIGEELPAVRDT